MSEVFDGDTLLDVKGVSKLYRQQSIRGERIIRAVDGVSLKIRKGEIFGIVGESGCGKSTLARLISGLVDCTSGEVRLSGENIDAFNHKELTEFRQKVQMVFQDPEGSLNPRKKVGDTLTQPFKVHHLGSKGEQRQKVLELLEQVKLSPPEYYFGKYPYELSGGAKQRVGIARALALEPRLLVADEPVASLDVSIRGAILSLLRELNQELHIAVLLISHDLNVIQSMVTRIVIMYLGKIVETGSRDQIFSRPKHPYTVALESLNPVADPAATRDRKKITLTGEVPSPSNPPPGCRFHTRCPLRLPACSRDEPGLIETARGHHVACHLARARR
jgi:oligopeptide/dipeptide ABC transporter ATP-binding protein